jgi:hypothetical protein
VLNNWQINLEDKKMKELTCIECNQVSGANLLAAIVLAIAIYDGVTDFAEGFSEGVKSER